MCLEYQTPPINRCFQQYNFVGLVFFVAGPDQTDKKALKSGFFHFSSLSTNLKAPLDKPKQQYDFKKYAIDLLANQS